MPPDPGATPTAWIEGCTAAQARLHAAVDRLTDEVARESSPLPGWTVGHLVTHLARNADSHRGMVEAAQRGAEQAQYPGGPAQRNADIEAGAGRTAAELIADLHAADEALEAAWAATPERAWRTGLGVRRYGPATLAEFVFLRWREVEIHLLDLDLPELGSPGRDGLSAAYVEVELQELGRSLAGRVPPEITLVLAPGDRPSRAFGGGHERFVIEAPAARLVAWLMGRGGDPAWPALRPWE